MLIDLLQWHEPKDHSPPYANLYRPGLARLALRSCDLQADYDYLVAQGVEVLSPPATVYASANSGSRFFASKTRMGRFWSWLSSFSRCRSGLSLRPRACPMLLALAVRCFLLTALGSLYKPNPNGKGFRHWVSPLSVSPPLDSSR